jgi:hypothetical protein
MNTQTQKSATRIEPWRSKTRFADANWVAQVKTGEPQRLADGSFWTGWDNIGHYKHKRDALNACEEVNK